MSGVPATSGGGGAPSNDLATRLEGIAQDVRGEEPWYEFLGLKLDRAEFPGSDVAATLVLSTSVVEGFVNMANETILAPMFTVVKSLIDAIRGAAEARRDLVALVEFCVALSKCVVGGSSDAALPSDIKHLVDELVAEMEAVEGFVKNFRARSNRSCCVRLMTSCGDRDTIAGHRKKLQSYVKLVELRFAVDTVVSEGEEVLSRVPSLSERYVRRGEESSVVSDLVDPRRVASACHCLWGMGGSGKSAMASSVVRDDRVRFSFIHGIFWVTVSKGRRDGVKEVLDQLVMQFLRSPVGRKFGAIDESESVDGVIRRLEQLRGSGRCLAVLDDVWDGEVVEAVKQTGFHVLVTTRKRSVVRQTLNGMFTEVSGLSDEGALEVLKKESGASGPLPEVEAELVARECGNLPVALVMAGKLGVEEPLDQGCWRGLLEKLEGKKAVWWTMESMEDGGSLLPLMDASRDMLPAKQKEQFQQLALVAPEVPLTQRMLANLWKTHVSDVNLDAEVLVDYCLVRKEGDVYRLHPLVADYLQLTMCMNVDSVGPARDRQAKYLLEASVVHEFWLREEDEGVDGGLYWLAASWKVLVDSSDGEVDIEGLYMEQLNGAADEQFSLEVGDLMMLMGKYACAESIFGRLRSVHENTPEERKALGRLGDSLERQGKYDEAEDALDRAVQMGRGALGADSPDFAVLLSGKARVLQAKGSYNESEALYRQAIDIHKKTPKARSAAHRHIATGLSGLAEVLWAKGNVAKAEACSREAFDVARKRLDRNHPDVAAVAGSRADLLVARSEKEDAHSLYLRAINVGTRTLGSNHPSVAVWRGRLSEMNSKA